MRACDAGRNRGWLAEPFFETKCTHEILTISQPLYAPYPERKHIMKRFIIALAVFAILMTAILPVSAEEEFKALRAVRILDAPCNGIRKSIPGTAHATVPALRRMEGCWIIRPTVI